MTAGGLPGLYGGYSYQSPTLRSLGKITPESYDYRDQAKVISKLVGDVSFMGGMMRKMQKGIDDANQNFIQQLQSLVRDFFVLLGGGGDTGLDFGDLKYILQAIGALFGFDSGVLPINLFQAAWHFFSNYIIPVDNFHDLMDFIIDGAIASILDIFGEVPILGQALQQLAVIISNIRDALGPLTDALDRLFGAFGGDWLSGDFGAFDPLWDAVLNFFGVITGPVVEALVPILQVIATWSMPFIEALTFVVDVVANIISALFGDLNFTDFQNLNFDPITVISKMISNLISNGLLGPNSLLNAFNIFGLLNPGNIPFLPFSHIGEGQPELLVEPGFLSATAIAPGGSGWQYDETVGHTALGSAKATAGGIQRTLVSDAIAVSQNQQLAIGVWIRWASAVYTGTNHVTLALNSYTDTTLGSFVGSTAIANQTFATATQSTWQHLTGNVTIGAGVNYIRFTLKVNPNVSSGSVWFDDASVKKTGLIQVDWVDGLFDFIDNVVNAISSIPFGGLLGGILGFWADFVHSLLGLGGGTGGTTQVLPAYTPQNAAVADLQGQVNALQAAVTTGTEGEIDPFTTSPLSSNWTAIFNSVDIDTTGGYVKPAHPGSAGPGIYYSCQSWNKNEPATGWYQVQFTLVTLGTPAGALSLGAHTFGIANATVNSGRFITVRVDVDTFGVWLRLGSITGPVNAYNQAYAGWVEYFNTNIASIVKGGDVFAIEVNETDKTYKLYMNPGPGISPLNTFTDSSNTLSRTAGNRKPFFQLNALNDPFGVGNGWDNFRMFDRT